MNNLIAILKTALISALYTEMPRIYYYSNITCPHVDKLWKENPIQLSYLTAFTLRLKQRLTKRDIELVDRKHKNLIRKSKFKK